MFEVDELDIYRGGDIEITPKIIVTQPTLGQIADFGEKRYFNAVYTLTAVGADLKWQLWDLEQIDYTKIEDYDLFIKFISRAVSSSSTSNIFHTIYSMAHKELFKSVPSKTIFLYR